MSVATLDNVQRYAAVAAIVAVSKTMKQENRQQECTDDDCRYVDVSRIENRIRWTLVHLQLTSKVE